MFVITKDEAHHFYMQTRKSKNNFEEKFKFFFSPWASVQAAESNLMESVFLLVRNTC